MQTHSELLSLCLRYSCSVSFSRFSAHRLACASRASLFILARPKTFVNAFLQLFSLFFSPFSFCERFLPKKNDRSAFGPPQMARSLPIIRLWIRLVAWFPIRVIKALQLPRGSPGQSGTACGAALLWRSCGKHSTSSRSVPSRHPALLREIARLAPGIADSWRSNPLLVPSPFSIPLR